MSGERTERASPRRRQQAAERGDRVRSRELMAAAAMLAGVLVLGVLVERWAGQWRLIYEQFLALGAPHHRLIDGAAATDAPAGMAEKAAGVAEGVRAIRSDSLILVSPLALLMAAVIAGALLAGAAQNGGLALNASALRWNWQRVNPVANAKNLVSMRGMARLLKSLLPAAILAVFAVRRILAQMTTPPLSVRQLPEMLSAAYSMLLDTAWILFAWSAVDYLVEWRSWESRQRMSKQELREEQKQTEGSPQIRGRIKSLRRQMRRRLLKADISRATVVLTNPTHYAVALSFSFETMEPPRLLAKGRDLLAAQMRDEARWAGVPIVENPPLARSLYHQLEPGQTIPYDLYAAVAAILAYLYRQRVEERLRQEAKPSSVAKSAGARRMPAPPPWTAGKNASSPNTLRNGPANTAPESSTNALTKNFEEQP